MNLHEYQAKVLLSQFGVAVPGGIKATSQQGAVEAAKAVREKGPWVVKAQVHAGGRGKAGGVKFVRTIQDVEEVAGRLLGSTLVTKQTGSQGVPVHILLIQDGVDIAKEYYLSCLVDRAKKRIVFIGSSEGGMDIEEVAAKTPEKILTVAIDPIVGIQPYQCRQLGFQMGMSKEEVSQMVKIMTGVYNTFVHKDCSLIEINPLILEKSGQLMALDAKISLDDNALYRNLDVAELRDPTQEDEREHIAHEIGLNYVALDGSIGCMVNGAGLAMATMDVIKLHGGDPANFLDVGGGATADRVARAFKLILSSDKVKAILVNIFGGIVRCDTIAEGIITAVKEVGLTLPVVVRLQGTNVEAGREMLAQSGMNIMTADDLTDAAKMAVAAAA
ncbi:MAG: ADP-forming succinate--CoA ligase subunit beta [Candidatus Competibacteraceae bacterium]|uniref:Succinate--CoA ligase [ADP-forming] subunit beta n=1 Tax=Candidatus Contendobacter odensis Run_B_J11 TaxID=1400861 RepID=A0A7U7GAR6_9GAMM|nr:ADP-forming succinate--CoA ligase subunit beta [Candidatus Contendobacter odensis]MBK8537903.1 ADP-forming succinate--CoA ligase subunit beta [Candidatus Competibacteraceae bacterium]MBK8750157.1 ADP-forming succinate--CoA ligase subunit beta [Candidatus Competibacteraceae bacterium]CDH44647.1 succinyl-CoA synthetase, beta subunit [Candidatus Contendobacter odensis Run_B_J11]